MNNKVVTLEADMPLYLISEKSSNPIFHMTPGKRKKYLVGNRKGENKSKSSLVQICGTKTEQFDVEATQQVILGNMNCLLDKRIFMTFLLFKDKIVLFLDHRLTKSWICKRLWRIKLFSTPCQDSDSSRARIIFSASSSTCPQC